MMGLCSFQQMLVGILDCFDGWEEETEQESDIPLPDAGC